MRESGENYLETIYLLKKRSNAVHAVDIAHELNFSKPSVTRALGLLKAKGLIVVDSGNHIQFTADGLKLAESIYERHQTLSTFLIKLGVSQENAEKDACRIEHVISDETLQCIKNFNNL